MKLTFGEFKSNKQGAYILIAAEDIDGFLRTWIMLQYRPLTFLFMNKL